MVALIQHRSYFFCFMRASQPPKMRAVLSARQIKVQSRADPISEIAANHAKKRIIGSHDAPVERDPWRPKPPF